MELVYPLIGQISQFTLSPNYASQTVYGPVQLGTDHQWLHLARTNSQQPSVKITERQPLAPTNGRQLQLTTLQFTD